MANLRQDRVPGPTLSHPSASPSEGPAVNGRAPATLGVALSLRLRTSDSSGREAAVSIPADSPAKALAIDVITASGGALDSPPNLPQGPALAARFANFQSALLAARRLHWALEGLAESARSSVNASIAIYLVEDGLPETAAAALETLAPGRVLLTERLAEAIQQLPGLTLHPAAGNWRELEWRSPAEAAGFAADEQSVLGRIHALGREDPLAVSAAQPAPAPVAAVSPASASHQAPAGLGRSVPESQDVAQPFWKKPWAAVSAGAVVLVIVAILVIRGMAPGPHPQTAAPDSSPKTPAPVTSSTPAAPAPQQKPSASKPPAKSAKQPRPEPQPTTPPKTEAQTETPKPLPPPVATSCNLTETEIPLSLQRAGRLMSAGKLPEAQDAYQRLVGCPSAHDRAVEGLRQVKQRMGFQGTPN